MIGKFIFVPLCLYLLVQLLLASGSSPRKEQIPAVDQNLFGIGCHKEKKRIDQLVGTIDALKKVPAKDTIADMENTLHRERANNQELQVLVQKLTKNLELCEEKRKMFNNYVLDSFLRDSPYSGVENYTRYAVARLGMLPIKNAKPLIPEFGPVINDVLSFRYPINIPSCPAAEITNNTSANPSVFIAIISAPGNFKKRNDIRETWLIHLKSVLEKNLLGMARFGFFLGKTQDDSIQKRIEEESQKHGDIVQIEMDDSYRNLTLKGIAVLNWVRQHCASKVDLVFKVDDDVYVNVHNLVHFVRSNYQSNNSFFGYAIHQTHPDRGKDSKYYIPLEEYPWRHYPNYVQGPAYFIHASVVISLLAASQTIPFNPFEDVFLAGMCRERAGVKMQYSAGQPRFLFYIQYRPKKSERTPFSKAQFNVDSLFLTFKTSYYV
jgi:hypothetical protein